MRPYMLEDFGNPSSTHAHGRKVRAAIETCRKTIAELLNCTPGEIIFTSGGTEADNAIIFGAIKSLGIRHVISSPIEHHAVEHTLHLVAGSGTAQLHMVELDAKGNVNLEHLGKLLSLYPGSLVSLMHANNEIGNLLDIEKVGDMCAAHQAYFHSDTVQTMGHYAHPMNRLKVDGATAAAHKFHGPKGTGFMFLKKDKKITPFVSGGAQERNMRGGTENTYGIVGLTKALEIAYRDMADHEKHIKSLKLKMIEKLKEAIPGIEFNGESESLTGSLYTVLNVSLPESEANDMLLFNLDLEGISASGGSACSSGAATGSHVINALRPGSKRGTVRFSFSKYNTEAEIDFAADRLIAIAKS